MITLPHPSATWRSLLFIPANNEKFIAAAASRGADAIILDLEDSIPYALKAEARQSLPDHISHLSAQNVDVVVRINYDMINAVADLDVAVTKNTAAILVPKVLGVDHLRLLDDAIGLLESQRNIPKGSIKLIALIETIVAIESAAVIAIGVMSFFIAACLLPREFLRSTLRRYDLRFHKLARAHKDCHARNRQGQMKRGCLLV